MTLFTRHIILPSIAPLSVIGLYLTPVSLLGCTTRGFLALAVVFASLGIGISIGMRGLRLRVKGESGSGWWIASMSASTASARAFRAWSSARSVNVTDEPLPTTPTELMGRTFRTAFS